MNLGYSINLASFEFKEKLDKGGNPYILHLLYVMNEMVVYKDIDLMIIGVLHDLFEDTTYTAEDLLDMGYSFRVVDALVALTHVKDESYDDYIKRIAVNVDARKVKLADLRHNSDITRMKGLREKDFKRLEKYHRAYMFLSE